MTKLVNGYDPAILVCDNPVCGYVHDYNSLTVLYSTLLHLPPPQDSTAREDAGIEPRTVAASALKVRRRENTARYHPRWIRFF
jgi:hypothetical protein